MIASRSARRALAFLAVLASLAGCRTGPDPACVRYCEQHNDACMLHATNAAEVQACDGRVQSCLALCR